MLALLTQESSPPARSCRVFEYDFGDGGPTASSSKRSPQVPSTRCTRSASAGNELALGDGFCAVGFPSPDSVGIGFELGVAERPFEARGVDRAGGYLEDDLDIDVGGP